MSRSVSAGLQTKSHKRLRDENEADAASLGPPSREPRRSTPNPSRIKGCQPDGDERSLSRTAAQLQSPTSETTAQDLSSKTSTTGSVHSAQSILRTQHDSLCLSPIPSHTLDDDPPKKPIEVGQFRWVYLEETGWCPAKILEKTAEGQWRIQWMPLGEPKAHQYNPWKFGHRELVSESIEPQPITKDSVSDEIEVHDWDSLHQKHPNIGDHFYTRRIFLKTPGQRPDKEWKAKYTCPAKSCSKIVSPEKPYAYCIRCTKVSHKRCLINQHDADLQHFEGKLREVRSGQDGEQSLKTVECPQCAKPFKTPIFEFPQFGKPASGTAIDLAFDLGSSYTRCSWAYCKEGAEKTWQNIGEIQHLHSTAFYSPSTKGWSYGKDQSLQESGDVVFQPLKALLDESSPLSSIAWEHNLVPEEIFLKAFQTVLRRIFKEYREIDEAEHVNFYCAHPTAWGSEEASKYTTAISNILRDNKVSYRLIVRDEATSALMGAAKDETLLEHNSNVLVCDFGALTNDYELVHFSKGTQSTPAQYLRLGKGGSYNGSQLIDKAFQQRVRVKNPQKTEDELVHLFNISKEKMKEAKSSSSAPVTIHGHDWTSEFREVHAQHWNGEFNGPFPKFLRTIPETPSVSSKGIQK
ncbi:MAG: hypothetical protein Q9198_008580, partial [Flavoplaca austrocitrina]